MWTINDDNKKVYYSEIIRSIIDTQMADSFIIALCRLIQNLTIDSLHIIGDIFDRGPRADIIMEELMHCHDVDIQWGNHDISWMGAATGNPACISAMCCGSPLVIMVLTSWRMDMELISGRFPCLPQRCTVMIRASGSCRVFWIRIFYDAVDPGLCCKMHKAIAIIRFGGQQTPSRVRDGQPYPSDGNRLSERNGCDRGKGISMMDMEFPTIDPSDPLKLSEEEEELLHTLTLSFCHSALLTSILNSQLFQRQYV